MRFGKFEGEVLAKWLKNRGDDRNMELLADFRFTDNNGQVWNAPKGSIINGASIPSALWATVGPPFVGDYRRASVVHDVACVDRTQSDEAVHLMFYFAMRTDGLGWTKANIMYQAVKRFGPKWSTASGAILKQPKPRKKEILEFAEAVKHAAKEVDEELGLEAVEIRADELLIIEKTKGKKSGSKPKKSKTKPKAPKHEKPKTKKKKQKSVSRIRKVGQIESGSQSSDTDHSPAFATVEPTVRKHLESTRTLKQFRVVELGALQPATLSSKNLMGLEASAQLIGDSGSDGLTNLDRLRLIEQALVLLEQNYVHRPLKEAMHAINPIQNLRLLREQVIQQPNTAFENDLDFHRKLAEIFLSTRDLHTNYFLPDPFARQTAYIPFLVEDFFENDDPNQRRFLVTRILGSFDHSSFEPGVEILRWNGVPIDRAVEINGDRYAGSNLEARRSRGLETLTVRPLVSSLPPEEDFILVEYQTSDGEIHELRFEWLVFSPDTADIAAINESEFEAAIAQGIDLEQAIVRMAKKLLFAPEAVAASEKMAGRKKAVKGQGLDSLLPNVLQAKEVETPHGKFGYVRIRSFSVHNADRFVREFVRLAKQLPDNGLIIDVRGNGGGLILAGEQLLQVLTPRKIQPTLFQFLNTPLNRRIVELNGFLEPWRESMRQSVQTGAAFSQGYPITSPKKANELGQRYYGPVVLITDALCYSTTDIFAAGFQDHEVGTIIGIDNNTGAGGANVWPHDLLSDFLSTEDSPYQSLPSNSGMRVSIRRTIRVGKSSGTVLEDLGVVPDIQHAMTRNDLINSNVDLIAKAGEVLSRKPSFHLNAKIQPSSDGQLSLNIETRSVDRVDFYEGSRPLGSIDVEDGNTEIEISIDESLPIRLEGFENGKHVATAKLNP